MPLEFSAAAYRYGHSQVRSGYTINNTVPTRPTFVPDSQLPPAGQVFERRRADFRGFTRFVLPPQWTIDWPFFFQLDDQGPQPSLKIDTKIAGPLTTALPGANQDDADLKSLPRRNLLRGAALGLPSGQWVARAMDEVPLDPLQETPLWYYILKEAGKTSDYFASTHDVAPTVLGAMSIEQPRAMQGQDLSVLLDGKDPEQRRPHFTLGYDNYAWARDDRYVMFGLNDGSDAKLYDIEADPSMGKDIASDHPEIVKRMFTSYILNDAGGPVPKY